MIARPSQSITLRGNFYRVALLSLQFVLDRSCWPSLSGCQRIFKRLRVSVWLSDLAGCGQILLHDRSDRLRFFAQIFEKKQYMRTLMNLALVGMHK